MHCFRRTALAALTVSSASALQLGVARTAWSRSNGALLRGGAQQMSGLATYPVNPEIALTSATIEASSAAATAWAGDVLVVPFWEPAENTTLLTPLSGAMADLDGAVGGALADLIEDMEFKGGAGKTHVIALPKSVDSGARKLAVVGLGKADDWKVAGARKLGDSLATIAKEQKAKAVGALLPSERESRLASINRKLKALGHAPMREDEFVATRLYDGPMVAKYNAVLRALVPSFGGGPVQALEYERLCERNSYATTLHALNSGIAKMNLLLVAEQKRKAAAAAAGSGAAGAQRSLAF